MHIIAAGIHIAPLCIENIPWVDHTHGYADTIHMLDKGIQIVPPYKNWRCRINTAYK